MQQPDLNTNQLVVPAQNQVTIIHDEKLMVMEASDFPSGFLSSKPILVWSKTNNEWIPFELLEVERDSESDVMWWMFVTKDPRLSLNDWKLKIFND